jgi:hypothetical protein
LTMLLPNTYPPTSPPPPICVDVLQGKGKKTKVGSGAKGKQFKWKQERKK